jgi:RecA/RadA recombinase
MLDPEEVKVKSEIFKKQVEQTKEFMQKHIIHAKCANAAALFVQLQEINRMISEGEPIKLVIIDSLTQPFRGNYVGRGTMYSRTDDMKDITKIIKDMADVHRMIIVFNSQVYSSPDKKQWEPDAFAYGGHILGHAPQHRLQLDIPSKNPKNPKRRLSVIKSNYLINDEALYKITSAGIEDYE